MRRDWMEVSSPDQRYVRSYEKRGEQSVPNLSCLEVKDEGREFVLLWLNFVLFFFSSISTSIAV